MSNCYAVEDPIYQPGMRIISAITKASPAVVTTTFDHDFITGTIVRLVIPRADGMTQGDKLTGEITVTGTDTFSIDIDSRLFDTFSIPSSPSPHTDVCALVIPIGSKNSILTIATKNTL